MKPAPHTNGKFDPEELTLVHLKQIAALPYEEAMQHLYNLTGVKKAKSRYFTQMKIELWTAMPEMWRISEVLNFIEQEAHFEGVA